MCAAAFAWRRQTYRDPVRVRPAQQAKLPCSRLAVEKVSGRRGTTKMRILTIAACVALGGCWTSGQDAATANRPGDQFVGQNVDTVVARFGKPTGRKKMDNDQMTYVW